jgi:hypothetical protein
VVVCDPCRIIYVPNLKEVIIFSRSLHMRKKDSMDVPTISIMSQILAWKVLANKIGGAIPYAIGGVNPTLRE